MEQCVIEESLSFYTLILKGSEYIVLSGLFCAMVTVIDMID